MKVNVNTCLDKVTVADLEACLKHNNYCVLLNSKISKYFYPRFRFIREQCQAGFKEIQRKMGDEMNDNRIRSAESLSKKYELWEMKRTIFALCYNLMKYAEPNAETIKILRENGIDYDTARPHHENIQLIYGQIGRCEAVMSETRIRLENLQGNISTEQQSMDYLLMMLNYVAKSNLRKSTTTISEYIAAKKIVEKINAQNEKTK